MRTRLTRRQLLKATGVTAGALAFPNVERAQAPRATR
jgi:hypothetical protein